MSYEAIYQVTRMLQRLLYSQVRGINSSAVVTLLPLGADLPARLGLNLYLYRVVESPFAKNRPLPGERGGAGLGQAPLSLELSYLLTPLGVPPDQAALDGDSAHTMLGKAMLVLHEHPVLGEIHRPEFDADVELPSFLRESYEQIRVRLAPAGLDELSKLWAMLNQPFRLSVAYDVSLVELTAAVPQPASSTRVTTIGLDVATLQPPRLDRVLPDQGALCHLAGGRLVPNELQLEGSGLLPPDGRASVRVGGQPVAVQGTPPPSGSALVVQLPPGLHAGPQTDVQVVVSGRASLPLPFRVNPWLARIAPVRAAPDPRTGTPAQTLRLEGGGFVDSPLSIYLDGPGGPITVTAQAGSDGDYLTATIPPSLQNGLYEIRVVLGDAIGSVSNPRMLEIYPLLDRSIDVLDAQADGNALHQLVLRGARLSGRDLRLLIDGAVYQAGPNTSGTEFRYTFSRRLPRGSHRVELSVDGQLSDTIMVEVPDGDS